MSNKLPEKLALLRKHYGYSQGDLAERLNIPVTEYMNWENGNALPHIAQLVEIASLFHVSVDVMLDNTKEAQPVDELQDQSAQIPFMNGSGINATQQLAPGYQYMDQQSTDQLNTIDASPADEQLGSTRRMDTLKDADFSSAETQRLQEEPAKEEKPEEKGEKPKKNSKKKKPMSEAQKKRIIIVSACAAAAAALIIILVTVIRSHGSRINLASVNRLAEGDQYTLYVDADGNTKTWGNFSSDFSDTVQVSAYGSHAAGLKSDGTVVTNDGEDVSGWNKVTMIAAGADHTVGLRNDGSVVCTGNADACEVTDWSDMKAVYAGNGVTAGITNDDTLKLAGADDSLVSSIADAEQVSFSDDTMAVLLNDGTVKTVSLNGGTPVDTSSLTGVESIASGNGFVVGLTNKGKVVSAGLDSANVSAGDAANLAASFSQDTDSDDSSSKEQSVTDQLSNWSNIRYLAAYGNTIVAFDRSGQMHGAGDNTYGQYEETAPKATEEADKLSTPGNIQVSASTTNIVIKWDSVENADYYTVTLNGSDLGSFDSNSASVPVSSLEDGKSYTITITAHSNDTSKYKDSDAGSISYTFQSQTQQLSAPSGINASIVNDNWLITWNPVENATSYTISLGDGDNLTSNTNQLTVNASNLVDGYTYTVSVTATSSSSAYSDSDPGTAQLTYSASRKTVTFHFYDQNKQDVGQAGVNMTVGSHSVQEALDLGLAVPSGCTVDNPSATFEVSPGSGINLVNVNVTSSSGGSGE